MECMRLRKWALAKDIFLELASKTPMIKSYRAYLSVARGREFQDLNRHDVAAGEFRRALELVPRFEPAIAALEQMGENEKSPGFLRRLLKK